MFKCILNCQWQFIYRQWRFQVHQYYRLWRFFIGVLSRYIFFIDDDMITFNYLSSMTMLYWFIIFINDDIMISKMIGVSFSSMMIRIYLFNRYINFIFWWYDFFYNSFVSDDIFVCQFSDTRIAMILQVFVKLFCFDREANGSHMSSLAV